MDYTKLSSEHQIKELLSAITHVLGKYQDLRAIISLPNEDGRNVGIYGIQTTIFSLGLTYHAIIGAGLTPQRTKDEVLASFKHYHTFEGKTDDQMIDLAADFWKNSVLSLTHFRLDSLFRNLIKALGGNPGSQGFGPNTTLLFNLITLRDRTTNENILDIFSAMRNSLHNNGIHIKNPIPLTIFYGMQYEFQPEIDIKCASFGHIFAILEATADVLTDVLTSPEIIALPKVEDLYADLNPE
ncbi:MAG: hypothetical protein JWO50_638 [Candidatus Kaiserbacteria bacterium]|nr:hypothetical protein [Candidatus Kaiserbacteria bacterium]